MKRWKQGLSISAVTLLMFASASEMRGGNRSTANALVLVPKSKGGT